LAAIFFFRSILFVGPDDLPFCDTFWCSCRRASPDRTDYLPNNAKVVGVVIAST